MEDYVDILVGTPADIETAKANLDGIPYKILSIPHDYKHVKLTVPALFEFAARSRLNLLIQDENQ